MPLVKTRGTMGLYHSPGFCHKHSFITKECYMSNIYAFIGPQKEPPLYLNKS